MKLIADLNDAILLGKAGLSSAPPRLTARAIVRNTEGLYAVMYAEAYDLYTLPGGGLEEGEDVLTALRREILEETGCCCESIDELGVVKENRACLNYTQISYYYLVCTGEVGQAPQPTNAEEQNGTRLLWRSFQDVVRLISTPQHTSVQRKYLQARDVAALNEYASYRYRKQEEPMDIRCVWEHNGHDSLIYAIDYPGAFARGASPDIALSKMKQEITAYTRWLSVDLPPMGKVLITQEAECDLQICDADSDVLFDSERGELSSEEYFALRDIALKSADDVQTLYDSVPDKDRLLLPARTTFYGQVPRTAAEMYDHTKNVNSYYFAEIDVPADNSGLIRSCRERAFAQVEAIEGYLANPTIRGSYGEEWSLRKVIRRFIWHDRIHARAMYRAAVRVWGSEAIADPFSFR